MKDHIQARSFGIYAQESLINGSEGKVMGVTSSGVFLLFHDRSIFLTYSDHESPFTIVIPDNSLTPCPLNPGDPVFFAQKELLFPQNELSILLEDAPVWVPPSGLNLYSKCEETSAALNELISAVSQAGLPKGFFYLLEDPGTLTPGQSVIHSAAQNFDAACRSQNISTGLESASALIGYGSGLTPSGDDWLTGYILVKSLIAKPENEKIFLSALTSALIPTFYKKTTWVSANRLEAAARGWSEQLFLRSIDFLLKKTSIDPSTLAARLYAFGHSSGVDTFVGIAYAIK